MPDDIHDAAPDAAPYAVRSVLRAVAILRTFSADQTTLPLSEIAARAALDKATTRRLLMTLKQAGLVDQNLATQHYSLGLGVLEIAGAVPSVSNLSDLAADLLRALADETGATVFLSVRRDATALCLGRYMADTAIQVRWWDVGGTRPMNCGGAPRLLLAYAPAEEQDRIIAAGLTRFTRHSELDPDRLRADLAAIRKRGWELAVDDVYEGLSALAVPFFDTSGNFVGAISLAGLTAQLADKDDPRHLPKLQATAASLSRRIRGMHDFTV